MERKESANGLQLVKFGAIRLKGHFSQLFMGTFAMVTPLALVVLVPLLLSMLFKEFLFLSIGIVVFAVLVGPMQIGYIKFFNGTINGDQPRISCIYSQFKFSATTIRTIYISMLLLLMYILGGILWIVPAGFAIAFFSMILFFVEKFEYPRLSMSFKECAKYMIGNRLALFSYKLIFYFVYFLLFIVLGLCLLLIHTVSAESLIIAWIVAVCSIIVFIFFYSMITLYFHSCNQIFFEDTLMYNERKKEKVRKEKEQKQKRIESNHIDDNKSQKEENKQSTKEEKEIVKTDNLKDKVVELKENKNTTTPRKKSTSTATKKSTSSTTRKSSTKTQSKANISKNPVNKKSSTTKSKSTTTKSGVTKKTTTTKRGTTSKKVEK